ncbi:type II secretion system F family protein [Corynebacterium sp. ES2794-CONJ1]|uniref:type II secretion system F family protein n=1 Tax=unclassified Corynebacterium TaxID=2624378 RepID=UPI00216AADF4|nr:MULTISPECIES: type II secretion system F family protein [unclassified Corynebacterium]MCS4490105.1 type II secretion system F family protein [Corynebacterium sp. ES2775-CONJ]MCS4492086.1 type II secretion system F family protein [Corynebacterium sp. ES2715-CONJ3]MCS4532194.1 type II secretion system F family protein [Corynebacterium sp. ES2730-CONJ]MCU9519590.1 type II secretion system F family protein [Corynebacterium sp. ES2794-CONJ1]
MSWILLALVLALIGLAIHPYPVSITRLGSNGMSGVNPRDGPKYFRRGNRRTHMHARAQAQDVELFAALIRTGLSHSSAARALGASGGSLQWLRAADLLDLGVAPERAWAELDDIGSALKNSAHSGASLAPELECLSARLTAEIDNRAEARAQRAGVAIAVPLSLCFLPAFILLGLVPLVLSLGQTILPF